MLKKEIKLNIYKDRINLKTNNNSAIIKTPKALIEIPKRHIKKSEKNERFFEVEIKLKFFYNTLILGEETKYKPKLGKTILVYIQQVNKFLPPQKDNKYIFIE